jgi:hypothetical protein
MIRFATIACGAAVLALLAFGLIGWLVLIAAVPVCALTSTFLRFIF